VRVGAERAGSVARAIERGAYEDALRRLVALDRSLDRLDL